MGTPEDVATEKYFTPPTLTEMLRSDLKMEPECDADAEAIEDTLNTIKFVFKKWILGVGLTDCGSTEAIRRLLITLIDEP